MTEAIDIAVVGATGVVGEALLEILAERKFPVGTAYALASERSVGKEVDFGRRTLVGDRNPTLGYGGPCCTASAQQGLFPLNEGRPGFGDRRAPED